MFLARIITRNPQDAFAVSEYLRSEGYTVETISPGEFRITPADLELDLNRCKKGEALTRAKAMVESQRGAAPVEHEVPAPEPALAKKAKVPVVYDIVGRPVAFADEEAPERQSGPMSIRNALASLLTRLTAPVRELQQWSSERRALKLEAEQERRREQELARERARQEMERRRVEAELAEQRRQEEAAAEQQAEQERARAALVRDAAIAAARDARHQQAEPALAEKSLCQQLPARSPEQARPVASRRPRPYRVMLRRATAAVLGASIMAFVGYVAYANRRPASPLSPGALMMNGSIKQEVPFGPVTITPPTAAVPKPSPVAAVPTKTSPVVRPATPAPRRKPQPNASTARLKHDSETE